MSANRSSRQKRRPRSVTYTPRLEQVEARQLLATFTVTSVADSGAGSLRQAILDANATPGANAIRFALPGPGPYSIAPATDLPTVSNTVTIDGTTQPGYAGTPIVELNGALETGFANGGNGLTISAPNTTVRGLVINRFRAFALNVLGANGSVIAGNFLGTDPSGTVGEGNLEGGINVSGTTILTIGGLTAADRNVISGNSGDGIDVYSGSGQPTGNVIVGNLIGTDVTGTRALGNTANGIFLGSSGNQIGGTGPGAANTIAFNGLAGVRVGSYNFETGVTANPVRGNAIFGNSALGIDLGDAGVTLNGSYGTGIGPNLLQSFPTLNTAYPSGSGTRVEGQLGSTPNSPFQIDFYANTAADPSGYGQGERYLGSTTVTTDPSGAAAIGFTLPVSVPTGQFITATATDRNNNTSEFSHVTSVALTAQADLAISLFGDQDPVLVGSNLTYTMTVTNNGPALATNTTVTDPLPSGVTFVSTQASQGTASVSGGVLTANLGDLATGSTVTVQLVVQPTAVGTLANTASVKADQADPVSRNNTAMINTTVNPAISADLGLAGSFSGTQGFGQDLTFSLVVTNYGPNALATGVVVTDTLPAGATLVSATPSAGTVSVSGGTLTAALGSIAYGGNATLQIVVRPTLPGIIINQAIVHGDQPDPNALNNTSTLPVSIGAPPAADLAVSTAPLPDPLVLGRPLTYSVLVTNNGPGDAMGATFSDELDQGVTFVSATSSQGSVGLSGGMVTGSLGTITAGQTVLVTIVVQPTALGTIYNNATAKSDEPDLVPANNTSAVSSQVVPPAVPPTILSQRLIVSTQAITGIVLTFSRPMDPVQAQALNNYELRYSANNGLPGHPGRVIRLVSARYDANARTVTLVPQHALALGRFYQLTANGAGASGLTDVNGVPLDGTGNGLPNGIYQVIFGRGTKVRPVTVRLAEVNPTPTPHVSTTTQVAPRSVRKPASFLHEDLSLTVSLVKHVVRRG
jgi:uncharacterized repeat protein (TIGR01451 family)